MEWETVIGLEVHVQPRTESKMFCPCSAVFGSLPNTNICPVCTGQPGVLPVPNQLAIELALKTAMVLKCRINQLSRFARKNYFYPDLPKNYQISQYEQPLGEKGFLELPSGR
ncbi:MAG TPA: Asp-tRNA(Asn)/Glu-tRNA(Gln) amidotransferase GatCAB subunit B, partial [bacterium]|nr:Asp-tRNA(Asn)/Glu-tRNA(Gln) amidotransferase GatCAB subunit B [bacterium]